MTKVMIFGASGMLGHKLIEKLGAEFEVAGTIREKAVAYDCLKNQKIYTGVDVQNEGDIKSALHDFRPDVIVNAVGIIKQLDAAKNAELSVHINSLLPHQLARMGSDIGAKLIHFSTDCVFSGNKGTPYQEDDFADAYDLYGRSKYLGEVGYGRHLTLRTSIIGPELRGNKSLYAWVLSQKGQTIKGFKKALYTGFPTTEIAAILAHLLKNRKDLQGVYQLASDAISKYDLIALLNDALGLGITLEADNDFFCDRRLDSTRFRADAGYTPPGWDVLVNHMAAEQIKTEEKANG